MNMGIWTITKYYERYNDLGIERLRVAWWGVRLFEYNLPSEDDSERFKIKQQGKSGRIVFFSL